MKTYHVYHVKLNNDEILEMKLETDNVLDGHYQIYRMFGRGKYKTSTFIKVVKERSDRYE